MMPAQAESTLPATRRTRRSIGANVGGRGALDKENATSEVGSSAAASRKKSRSKSMGPGGLEALKQATGNRRASLAAPIKVPRSILKPTMTSLPEISSLRRGEKRASPADSTLELRGSSSSASQVSIGSQSAAGAEDEAQLAAAREREELERRDARRKSLAKRRVSFAAEATLHTFHEIEDLQDSTTSTDTSRRASSSANASPNRSLSTDNVYHGHQNKQIDFRPQTDSQNPGQRKSRRSLSLEAASTNLADEDGTSAVYSSDSEMADAVEEIAEEEHSSSSSDSDDGTLMTIDTEEVTGTSVASDQSAASDDDSSTLDEVLRLAARRAGTQNLEHNPENTTGLDEGEEVIPSFGWIKKEARPDASSASRNSSSIDTDAQKDGEHTEDSDMDVDMEITHAAGQIIKPPESNEADQEDVSMDVTYSLGHILSQEKSHSQLPAAVADEDAVRGEATMDLTTAVGGIHRRLSENQEEIEENEEMSMELTTIMGGVIAQSKKPRPRTEVDDATMEMTIGMGRIISKAEQSAENEAEIGDDTEMMDITTAVGGIIRSKSPSPPTSLLRETQPVKKLNRDKADSAVQPVDSPSHRKPPIVETEPMSSASSGRLDVRGESPRRLRSGTRVSGTPSRGSRPRKSSPVKPTTPQLRSAVVLEPPAGTPNQQDGLFSPLKWPSKTAKNSPSPKKTIPSGPSTPRSGHKVTLAESATTLTPRQRLLSGVGIDRAGLGSPQVAALCERRGSIGDFATEFVLGKQKVSFKDPREMNEEMDKEIQGGENTDDGRQTGENDADGLQDDKDATLNLREMINSLSPKRNPLKGRKSLHVGSARGVLGKRPHELDDEDDAEDCDELKMVKGPERSPVKRIRLQQPPSKEETTGRLTRSLSRRSLGRSHNMPPASSSPSSPKRTVASSSPGHGVGSRAAAYGGSDQAGNLCERRGARPESASVVGVDGEKRIHLQDFLNMTSIRFMELTTTKRRHTVAPGAGGGESRSDGREALSLERCVVAGACTVPMLELYQHSCRELKKYISEGRRMVKEIESETLEENPPLFREYLSATAEVKALMDNQFKNVKTQARLQSKAMWYEWRTKLQEGLKEGLLHIAAGMEEDERRLGEQEEVLKSVLPTLVSRHDALEDERAKLLETAREIADCDPVELQSAREELTGLETDIAEKRREIDELRQHLETYTAEAEALTRQKQSYIDETKRWEEIRAECRGWTSSEVNGLKAKAERLEKEHGWAVTGLCGKKMSMVYRREIELLMDVDLLEGQEFSGSGIELLWYVADGGRGSRGPKTVEEEFFLRSIRDQMEAWGQRQSKLPGLLRMIGSGWDLARWACSQIYRIKVAFPTTVSRSLDSQMAVTMSLLLVPLATRLEVTLSLEGGGGPSGLEASIAAKAVVVYGQRFNVGKVCEYLTTRIGHRVERRSQGWSEVVSELEQRLIARGEK